MAKKYADLNVKGVALACGIIWGAYILLLGISWKLGYGWKLGEAFSTLYLGFTPTITGLLIGTIWGFADGFIAGAIFAWAYNKLKN